MPGKAQYKSNPFIIISAMIVLVQLQLLHTHLYFMLVWRPMASFMWAWPCGACRAPDPSLVLTEPWET